MAKKALKTQNPHHRSGRSAQHQSGILAFLRRPFSEGFSRRMLSLSLDKVACTLQNPLVIG